jgi:hypothetical protein
MTPLSDYDLWMGIREALLLLLDVIERKIGLAVRTSEIRKEYKSRFPPDTLIR